MENGTNGGGTALVRAAEETAVSVSAFEGNAQAFDAVQRAAKALATSTVVPTAYRNNLPNVLVAMEYAHRLGASVLAVMQNLDVIHGRPALRSTFLIGTVNASGRFTPIRFRWQGAEGEDNWGCRAVAKDRESGEECIGPLITIATAKNEGWYGKNGSKWQSIPELMLMYRAAGWWARVYAPELSLGLHTTDEIEDIAPAPTTATATLNQRLGLISAPVTDAEPEDVSEAVEAIERATQDVGDFLARCTPKGGDATDAQREKARGLACDLFEDGSNERAACLLVIDDDDLGKNQIGALIGKLQILAQAREGVQQGTLV